MTQSNAGMDDQRLNILAKRTARSGQVDYVPPIVLISNQRRIVELIGIYVRHDTQDEGLSIKLVQSRPMFIKSGGTRHLAGKDLEREINLDEEGTATLIEAVPQLAALKGVTPGNYLVLDLDGRSNVDDVDAGKAARALLSALSKPSIAGQLQNIDLEVEMVDALRSIIRIREIEAAIFELESMLSEGVNQERNYQAWCKKHSWAFGTAYLEADTVRDIGLKDQVDFLVPVMSGYRDIIELKRPDVTILSWDEDHRNYYFTSEVSKAVGQCHRYLDVAEKELQFEGNPEIETYHPRATIVIGRSNDWTAMKIKGLHGLNARLNGITVMTYDQLLSQARRLLEVLIKAPTEQDSVEEESDQF